MTIPVTSSRVNLELLDPLLKYRVGLMLADPRMAGYRVVSAVRTYEQQRRLYSGWRSRLPGFNLAANPDRYIGVTPEGWRFTGSFHMQQVDGYGHAVDLRKPVMHSRATAWRVVGEVGDKYGLQQTVSSEWWHLQARTIGGYFAGPSLPEPEPEDEEDDMVTLIDTHTNEGWVAAGNRARKLSDPSGWLATWAGPTRASKTMRYVIPDLYDLVQ